MKRCTWCVIPWHATTSFRAFLGGLTLLSIHSAELQRTLSRHGSAHCWPLRKPVPLPHSWVDSWPLPPRRVRAVRCGSGFPSVHAGMWQAWFCPLFGRVFRIIYPTATVDRCPLKFLVNSITRALLTCTPRFPPHYQRCRLTQNNPVYFRRLCRLA